MEQNKRITDTVALRKVMVEKGFYTTTSLADAAGINRNTLGSILNGQTQPSAIVMHKLVETLELSEIDAGCIFFASTLRNS